MSQFVHRNVLCCVSGIVHTMAQQYGIAEGDVGELAEEAFELFQPTVDDDARAEALDNNGAQVCVDAYNSWFVQEADGDALELPGADDRSSALEAAVAELNLEDEARECAGEIYEHWVVTAFFGAHLADRGHTVGSFGDLRVWGRPCTGQAISMDRDVIAIFRDTIET